jgi:hypothetical protein
MNKLDENLSWGAIPLELGGAEFWCLAYRMGIIATETVPNMRGMLVPGKDSALHSKLVFNMQGAAKCTHEFSADRNHAMRATFRTVLFQ